MRLGTMCVLPSLITMRWFVVVTTGAEPHRTCSGDVLGAPQCFSRLLCVPLGRRSRLLYSDCQVLWSAPLNFVRSEWFARPHVAHSTTATVTSSLRLYGPRKTNDAHREKC